MLVRAPPPALKQDFVPKHDDGIEEDTRSSSLREFLAEVCFRDFPVLKLRKKDTRSGDPGVDPRAGEASNREVAEDVKSEKTVAYYMYFSWWCIFAPIVVSNQHKMSKKQNLASPRRVSVSHPRGGYLVLCSVTGIISVRSCTAAFSPPCPTLPIPRAAHATAHASSISPYPGALYTKHDVILIAHTSVKMNVPPLLRRRRRPILRLRHPLRPRRLENRGVPRVNHGGGEPEIRSSRATRGGVVVIRRRQWRPRGSDHPQRVAVEALREHDPGAVAHAPRAGRPRGDDRLGRVDVAADRHSQTL